GRSWSLTVRDGWGIRELIADRVILAVPLGVLRAGDIVIDPPLPDTHRRAVSEIGLLDIVKAVMVVDLPQRERPSGIEELLSRSSAMDLWRGASEDPEAPLVISGFAAGAHARELLARDERARRARFVDELRRV